MTSQHRKTRKAIRRLLEEKEPVQLSLFEVSDQPLRSALFHDAASENTEEEESEDESARMGPQDDA